LNLISRECETGGQRSELVLLEDWVIRKMLNQPTVEGLKAGTKPHGQRY
jgi:hypothetical protein